MFPAPNPDGTVPYDNTVRAKLYAMGYTYNPKKARVVVRGFNGWKDRSLCYYETALSIRKKPTLTDSIVVLGSESFRTMPMHVITVNYSNNIVFDNNVGTYLEGNYVPGKGYFSKATGKQIYDELFRTTIREFLEATQKTDEEAMLQKDKVVVAKVDDKVMEDVIKSLYLMMYYVSTEKPKVTPGVKKRAVAWETSLKKFLATFRIPNDDFVALLKASRNSATYTAKVAALPPVVGNMLFKAKDKFFADNTIPDRELAQLEMFGRYFRTNNEKLGIKLLSKASNIKDAELLGMLSVEEGEQVVTSSATQKKLYAVMMKLSEKYLGSKLSALSSEQKKAFKAKAPEAYKQYTQARKKLLEAPRFFLKKTLRSSGKPLMDYKSFLTLLAKNKFTHDFPDGFVGKIDEDGNFYTIAGKQLQANPKSTIKMNPKYDAEADNAYVLTGKLPSSKEATKIYTKQWVSVTRTATKYDTMKQVKEEVSSGARAKWQQALMTGGLDERRTMQGAQLEMMYLFGARPGTTGTGSVSKSTGQKEPTYGILTLQAGHCSRQGNKWIISYPAKGGTPIKWVIDPSVNRWMKRIAEVLEHNTKDKGPKDPVWFDANIGRQIPTQNTLNWFKSLVNNDNAKLYSLRYMAADKVARAELGKFKPKGKVTQAMLDTFFNQAMMKVGAELKHHTHQNVTEKTAIANYVDPELMYKFFYQYNMRPNHKSIPKVDPDVLKLWMKEVSKSKK